MAYSAIKRYKDYKKSYAKALQAYIYNQNQKKQENQNQSKKS